MAIAPSTPTWSIAATISSPVTCAGQFGTRDHGRCGVFASYAWTWESMIGTGEAPRGRGCAAAGVRRSSAGPAVASATPTCSTVRRSISLSPVLDCLAISLTLALQDARGSDPLSHCSVRVAPVKGGRALRPRHPLAPDSERARGCTGYGSHVLLSLERHCKRLFPDAP